MNQLEWKDVVRSGMLIAALGAMWWQLDSKFTREIHALDNKIGQINRLLTENLIVLNREIGELRGMAHTHDVGL